MKKSIAGILAAVPLAALAATSTPTGFTDDLDAALKRAKESGKLVYVCFSGSDWCGWCIRLEKEVFSNASFAKSLTNDYELVFIDSPRDKSRLSEQAKANNPKITRKYKISGFPSMIVFDGASGEILAQEAAYRAGGAEEYVKFLMGIRKNPAALKAAKELEAKWLQPLRDGYDKLFEELNDECGKFIDAALKKPGNTKSRDELRMESVSVAKAMLPKFRALQQDAEKKSAAAPKEIREQVADYAQELADWIKSVEQM